MPHNNHSGTHHFLFAGEFALEAGFRSPFGGAGGGDRAGCGAGGAALSGALWRPLDLDLKLLGDLGGPRRVRSPLLADSSSGLLPTDLLNLATVGESCEKHLKSNIFNIINKNRAQHIQCRVACVSFSTT